MISVRIDARDIKVDALSLWKELTKRILKRRIEDEKKFTIPKIIRFETYRPVAAIKNDNEKDM